MNKITLYLLPIFLFLCFNLNEISAQKTKYKNLENTEDHGLSPEQLEDFKLLAKERLQELQNYISLIADKKTAVDDKELILKQIQELFLPGSTIEVSSTRKKKANSKYEFRDYFQHLADLPYLSVEIKWYDLAYVSNFQRTPNGNYSGTATVFQEIRGIGKGKFEYRDQTKKDVETHLQKDPYTNNNRYILFLGNVSVKETRKVEQ